MSNEISTASESAATYEGGEELAALEHATRYNAHIARLFAEARGTPWPSSTRVLDFGAGIGTISKLFSARTGLCPSTVELDAGQRAHLKQLGFEARAHVTDYPAQSFELVISSNVLEHIVDDAGTLSVLRSRLVPGGYAAFWVPAFPLLWTELDARVGHVRRYTRASLRRAFEVAGFEVLRVEHRDSVGFFAALAVKWLRRSTRLNAQAVRTYDRVVFPLSRAIDHVAWPVLGKNLFIVARRPS